MMKDEGAIGRESTAMMTGRARHDDISGSSPAAAITATALVTPTKEKHGSPPSSPPSAKVIHYTDVRTKALGVKAELEDLRRKQLAKNKRNEIVDNGETVPLSSSDIADFFLRKTQMDKAWRQEQRESIEYLHTYKNSAMADPGNSCQSTVENSCPTIYSQMDPFYQQQRALNQEWKRQQQVSMAFLHNYRDAAGTNGAGETGTNSKEAIVTPHHADEGNDIRAAIRFHELQKSLEERMTLAVNTPLPPDDNEPIVTVTESVKEDANDCDIERDENTADDCFMAAHDEQPGPIDQDKTADETIKDCIDDIDNVLEDLLSDTFEQDDKMLPNESQIDDADKDLESPVMPKGHDESTSESREMNGFDKLVEYMRADISSETAPDNLEELLEVENVDTDVHVPRTDVAENVNAPDEAEEKAEALPSGPTTSSPTTENVYTTPIESLQGTLPERQMQQAPTTPPSSRKRVKKKVESKIAHPHRRRVANQDGVPHYMTPTISTPERRAKVEPFAESRHIPRSPLYSRRETAESFKVKSNTCTNTWVPNLHPLRGGCERCLHFASEDERLKFQRDGHHYRVCNVRGGCFRACPCFPRRPDQAPVRLCRKCFYDTHRLGRM